MNTENEWMMYCLIERCVDSQARGMHWRYGARVF
jgi:hypothetical protein